AYCGQRTGRKTPRTSFATGSPCHPTAAPGRTQHRRNQAHYRLERTSRQSPRFPRPPQTPGASGQTHDPGAAMKHSNSALERLFRAAARVEPDVPVEAPFALESAVLAAWNYELPAENTVYPLPVMRRAFLCACAILAISTALTLHLLQDSPPSEI